MKKALLYSTTILAAILLFASCKKNDDSSTTPAGHALIHKITQASSSDTVVYQVAYNPDSTVASTEVWEYGGLSYTYRYSYSPSCNLAIKDYGSGFTDCDSAILSNGRITKIWHRDFMGGHGTTTCIYGNDGNLQYAIDTIAGSGRVDSTSYQWQDGNLVYISNTTSRLSFSYDHSKPFQPGDYYYINALTNNGDVQFHIMNHNLLTGFSGSWVGSIQYTYVWDSQNRIVQCKQHEVSGGDDTYWNIEY